MNNAVNILREGSMMKALTKLGIPIVIAMLIMAIYNVVDTFLGCTSWNSSCRRCIGCFPYIVVISWDRTDVRCRRRSVYIPSVGSETGCQGKFGRFRLSDNLCDVGSSHCTCVQCVPAGHPTFHGSKRGDDKFGRILRQAFYHQLCHRDIECVHVNIIVSQGASKTSASAMIIGSIVNVALDPLFIYTFNWGVEGAAWATIFSRIITTAIYIRFLTKAEVKVSLALFAPTIRIYADIIKIGISMLFLQLLQTLSICLLQKAAVKYGAEAVAAVGIVLKIVTLGTNVVFGFVKGLQPMAGYNYGAGNFQRLREAVCCSLILSTSFCVLWSILIVIFTSPIISCFGKDETMQEIARIALRANTIMFFTFGFQFVYSTLYMAIGRARQSLLLNIGRQGLFFIPIILLLPSYWELNGVLYAQPIADVFATLMTLFFAVRIHKEIGHKSHLTTENLQC